MPFFALLVFLAGLLVQIPTVSAQDAIPENESVPLGTDVPEDLTEEEDPLRAIERNLLFDDDGTGATTGNISGPSAWDIIRTVLVLAIVAVAIYGAVYFIRKASKPAVYVDPFLKILASSHLGANRYVHVVSIAGKAYLIGASDGGVNLISEVEDQDTINAMLLDDSRKTAETAPGRFDFMSMLRRLGTQAGNQSVPGAQEIRKRRERLKGL